MALSSAKIQYATISDTMGSFSVQKKSLLKNLQTLSADSYNKSMNIDEKIQTTEVITQEEICDELQSKRRKLSIDAHIVTKTNLKRIRLQQNKF